MKVQEALKVVAECGLNVETTVHDEVMKQIKNALEKQILKKPNYKSEYLMRFCPNCDYPLPLFFKFCNHCGQALDWSDVK